MSLPTDREMVRDSIVKFGNSLWLEGFMMLEENALDHVARSIEEFRLEYRRRFDEEADPFSIPEASQWKARAFFQPDTLALSTEMKIAVWRIMLGCEIQRILLRYEADHDAEFSMTLKTPEGEEETYQGNPARDYQMLRHLNSASNHLSNKLVINGYYALR